MVIQQLLQLGSFIARMNHVGRLRVEEAVAGHKSLHYVSSDLWGSACAFGKGHITLSHTASNCLCFSVSSRVHRVQRVQEAEGGGRKITDILLARGAAMTVPVYEEEGSSGAIAHTFCLYPRSPLCQIQVQARPCTGTARSTGVCRCFGFPLILAEFPLNHDCCRHQIGDLYKPCGKTRAHLNPWLSWTFSNPKIAERYSPKVIPYLELLCHAAVSQPAGALYLRRASVMCQ